MADQSHFHRKLQRRVAIAFAAVLVIGALVATPILVSDELRLDLALRFDLVPGAEVEQIAGKDDLATLVVLPLPEDPDATVPTFRYLAKYIAWHGENETRLVNVESNEAVSLPIAEFDFMAMDNQAERVLFRGPSPDDANLQVSVVVATANDEVDVLPEGQAVPDDSPEWDVPLWEHYTARCEIRSPGLQYMACFDPPTLSHHMAGDWQLEAFILGDYKTSVPLARGIGFFPYSGFAFNDTWIYYQNEQGISRVPVPQELLDQAGPPRPWSATPVASPSVGND